MKIGYHVFLLIAIAVIGCEKFLEIPAPKNEVVSEVVFSDPSTANAAMLAVYSKMANEGGLTYFIPYYSGLSCDELQNYSTDATVTQFYTNSLDALNARVLAVWGNSFLPIFQANSVIDNLKDSPIAVDQKTFLISEAKFVRAFWHFYLVNFYGDVPLLLSSSYSVNAVEKRRKISEIYSQIVADLKDAQLGLDSAFVAADGITSTNERLRPNRWTATALLARVYLYMNDFGNAEVEASKVIEKSSYFAIDSQLTNVFLKNTRENIWQLQPSIAGFNTIEGRNFILATAPTTTDITSSTISSFLASSFELGDKRRSSWISSVTVAGKVYLYPSKYKVKSGTVVSEYSTVLRLAEQYLIRAEARTQQGDIDGGRADLNVIRKRAGLLPNLSSVKDSLLRAIVNERRVEFFCEWGHRWLDLKRVGAIDSVMSVASTAKGGEWVIGKRFWPIPQSDRDKNPNLTQNPGYN